MVRTERRHDPATGDTYPWLVASTAMVNQFYFYAVDDDFGPFFLKFCSYFPYNAKLCINGHDYLKRQLTKRGIAYESLDNGILRCSDPERLQRLADGLTAAKVDALLRKWLARLPHPFNRPDRQQGIRYDISILQAEFALTQVFDRPEQGRVFFEEVVRENLDMGRPDHVQLIVADVPHSLKFSAEVVSTRIPADPLLPSSCPVAFAAQFGLQLSFHLRNVFVSYYVFRCEPLESFADRVCRCQHLCASSFDFFAVDLDPRVTSLVEHYSCRGRFDLSPCRAFEEFQYRLVVMKVRPPPLCVVLQPFRESVHGRRVDLVRETSSGRADVRSGLVQRLQIQTVACGVALHHCAQLPGCEVRRRRHHQPVFGLPFGFLVLPRVGSVHLDFRARVRCEELDDDAVSSLEDLVLADLGADRLADRPRVFRCSAARQVYVHGFAVVAVQRDSGSADQCVPFRQPAQRRPDPADLFAYSVRVARLQCAHRSGFSYEDFPVLVQQHVVPLVVAVVVGA